ncbi:MAG: glycosyltransferase family 4 protein, partial [Bacteroidales bacterium]|nr:glycosyltransferase family 4 protein [Bacteroidales bacterium]
VWIKSRKYNGNGLGRLVAMIQFISKIWIRAKRVSSQYKPDIVIASSTYPLDIYPAHRIARYSKSQLCFELHDLWPLSPMELGGYSQRHPFIKVMQRAEDYFCKHADKVISIIPLAKDYLIGRGLDGRKYFHVPNGVAREEWIDSEPLLPELAEKIDNLKSQFGFLIAYAGAHGIANALYTLLNAAERLSDKNVGIVLIGGGPERENLMKQSQIRGLNNIFFLETVPKRQIPALLNQFDALYIGLQKESLFRFGISPNKIFDYMMAGKPIVQAIDSGNNLVEEANCGVYAEAEDADEIVKAILKLKSISPDQRKKLGQNGKEYVLQNHTYSVLAKRFLEAIQPNEEI